MNYLTVLNSAFISQNKQDFIPIFIFSTNYYIQKRQFGTRGLPLAIFKISASSLAKPQAVQPQQRRHGMGGIIAVKQEPESGSGCIYI